MIYIVKERLFYTHKQEPIFVNKILIRETNRTLACCNHESEAIWLLHADLALMPFIDRIRFDSQLSFKLHRRPYGELQKGDVILVEADKRTYYRFLEKKPDGYLMTNLSTHEPTFFEETYPFRLFHAIS